MSEDRDRYEAYYAEKLWNLVPAIYRAEDSPDFDTNGSLRELVNRIGAQAAILRRSIDRMWEDQSIETCDDWVIPYLADLLATDLVSSLDARGQRLDVAKTIYFRRRKGTVAILEEVAADITGWSARVVEFFRRLIRTRHNLDPDLELPADTSDPDGVRALQRAEGLIGALTQTAIGGLADLRNVYGASRGGVADGGADDIYRAATTAAFDEFFHTADFRRGRGLVGWYNIPRLGVFLWRLESVPVGQTTPVRDAACPNQYTFDPTGRDIPLFAAGIRAYSDAWVSPVEWQLPTPMSQPLLQTELANLYSAIDPQDGLSILPNSLGVFRQAGAFWDLLPAAEVTADPEATTVNYFVDPERGRLIVRNPPPDGAAGLPYRMTYHSGFSSDIGAGGFDRRIPGRVALPQPDPKTVVMGGGNALSTPLAALSAQGTVTIDDFLTYDAVSDVTGIQNVTIRAENRRRPLIRLAAALPGWVLGGESGGELVLEGLFVAGNDVILRGSFDTVTLSCCTLDPGDYDESALGFRKAADGRDLTPCHLWVEGQVRRLMVDRSILGPIQTRAGPAALGSPPSEIETLVITDSIVQASGGDPAIRLTQGTVELSRCTILGPAQVHRLDASECILNDVVMVQDVQHGCVRFTAWATGSTLQRQYESVEVAPRSPLFASRRFGRPDYAQLLSSVDPAIAAGADDGSEMGAFAREKNPIKERSLLLKYEEYMPLGLVPVLIYVT
jgi:hypothetical protein